MWKEYSESREKARKTHAEAPALSFEDYYQILLCCRGARINTNLDGPAVVRFHGHEGRRFVFRTPSGVEIEVSIPQLLELAKESKYDDAARYIETCFVLVGGVLDEAT
jgi:hypothetical protein